MFFSLLRAFFWINPLIILFTALMGTANLLAVALGAGGSFQLRIARRWARMLIWAARLKIEVKGVEKIDPSRSYVFAANHLSYMDTPVVLACIPAEFRFLAKRGLFRIPFIGGHLKRAGHIPVPREDPRAALKTLAEAARTITEKRISVLVFPEGGRSSSGRLQPFKEGAAYLAIKAGVPAVPLALKGTYDVLPMGSIHVRPGRVVVMVGDPIATENLTIRDRGALNDRLHQAVAAMLGESTAPRSA